MLTITLSDGKERELKQFTLGMVRSLQKRTGREDLLTAPIEDLILEALVDKGGLTSEAIADLIPLSALSEMTFTITAAITGKSVAEVKKAAENPPEAAPAATI